MLQTMQTQISLMALNIDEIKEDIKFLKNVNRTRGKWEKILTIIREEKSAHNIKANFTYGIIQTAEDLIALNDELAASEKTMQYVSIYRLNEQTLI